MKKYTIFAIKRIMMALKEFMKKVFTRCKTIFNLLTGTNYKCTMSLRRADEK